MPNFNTIRTEIPGVTVNENSITFDDENMDQKVDERAITLYKERVFDCISVTGKKMYLGSILPDIATNFHPPKILKLDLFYAFVDDKGETKIFEDLDNNENIVRQVFSNWTGKNVYVSFLCNELGLRKFQL